MNTSLSHRNFARHGLTLVELLVSLSLLAVLVSVAVSWMTNIVSRQEHELEHSRWILSANLVLDQVGRDLTQLEMVDSEWRRGNPRVWFQEESLYIRTTDAGVPSTLRYAFDTQSGYVHRVTVNVQSQSQQSPPLIGETEALKIELEMPGQAQTLPSLWVEIRSLRGKVLSRSYQLRTQDVQP